MVGKDKNRRRGPQDDLAVWFNKALAGVPGAVEEVFRQCEQHLLHFIRRALRRSLRPVYDAEDFVGATFQAVLMADFRGCKLDSPQAVLRYLEKTALNKVRDERRKHGRNPRFRHSGEVSLESLPGTSPAMALNMAPDDDVLMDELINIRMAGQAKLGPNGLRIWAMLVAGYDPKQIAVELHIPMRTVQRVCADLKLKLEDESRGGRDAEGP